MIHTLNKMILLLLLLFLGATLLRAETVLYTTGSYTGNLGSRSAVDVVCNASVPAGCARGYAMLLYDGESILDLPIPTTHSVSMDGVVIASGWNTELYDAAFSTPFWSGFTTSGTRMTCSNWTSTDTCTKGAAGGALGLQTFTLECNRERPLLCYCLISTHRPTVSPTTSFPSQTPTTSRPSKAPSGAPSRAPAVITYSLQGSKLLAYNQPCPGCSYFPSQILGISLEISRDGTTLVVGANYGAYVFVRSGSTWTQQGNLFHHMFDRQISWDVTISDDGNTFAMGNDERDGTAGAAGFIWIYTRSGSDWTQQQEIAFYTGFQRDGQYHLELSADGNTLAASLARPAGVAVARDEMRVYVRSGGVWTEQYTVSTSSDNDMFGCDVAISSDGNDIVVGARLQGDGAVHAYHRVGTTWSFVETVNRPYALSGFMFGAKVSLSGDGLTMVVSTWATTDDNLFVYTRVNTTATFSLAQTITNPSPGAYGSFGHNGAISKNGLVIAASATDYSSNLGEAVIYRYIGGTWTKIQQLITPSGHTGTPLQFGYSLSMSTTGSYFATSGPNDNGNTGAVWVFHSTGL